MSKFKFLFFAFILSFIATPSLANEAPALEGVDIAVSDSGVSFVERDVREAAVRVYTWRGGHGSGSYIKYKDFYFIITAQHVADGPLFSSYRVKKGSETTTAILVWSDAAADIAVLMPNDKFEEIKPMKYKTTSKIPDVGTEIFYSGYPSKHQLMSIRGRVAGYEEKKDSGTQIMLHTYGWFGCSGSVIYNKRGEIIGVLWGLDVEYHPGIAVVEEMIWVIPIQKLDMKAVRENACWLPGVSQDSPRFCNN